MTIYVVTHEKAQPCLPDGYRLISVGGAAADAPPGASDSSGDNISEKNACYCELTAAYWIWKNGTSDIVGLMHYRRFLTTHPFSRKAYISENEVKKLLEGYDFIAGPLFRNKPSVASVMSDGVRERDFGLLREVMSELHPEMLTVFDGVFAGDRTYFCNIAVARKTDWDEYCGWLFPILFEAEKHIDICAKDSYQRRVFGFLAERLFNVWLAYKKVDVCYAPVYNVGDCPILVRIKGKLSQLRRK